jgi:hypothetical protein
MGVCWQVILFLLILTRSTGAGTSSPLRAVFCGGFDNFDVIDYVTIATIGNATDFGDLLSGNSRQAAFSNSHGGL